MPGFIHVEIKYLPQMSDATAWRYLFVAIDRVTCWVFLRIYARQDEAAATDFLRAPVQRRAEEELETMLRHYY